MGVDEYIIEGKVIGKDRVSQGDRWNPRFKITKWCEVDILIDFIVRVILIIELIIWIYLPRKHKL